MGLHEDHGLKLNNSYTKGPKNLITDVPGVKVGHVTLKDPEKGAFTGVTAVLPHDRDIFKEKVMGGAAVINGFGKSIGLVQLDELGTIEAPIMLTNTFGIGSVLNGTIRYMMESDPDIGKRAGTVNCIVMECNDGYLNDIRGMHVTEEDAIKAIEEASDIFEEGAVGAGTGMRCMGFKGGIGSASRILTIDGNQYTVGALVMTNFGRSGELRVDGKKIVPYEKTTETEKGSIAMIIGTDIPLNERQLRRVALRSVVGLVRTGSSLGNGSGDIAIAFSNANIVPAESKEKIINTRMFDDSSIDMVFGAAAESVEEAILSSLYHAESLKGFRGHETLSLRDKCNI